MIQDATEMECVYKHKDCPVLLVLDNQKQKLKEKLICADCLDLYKGSQNVTITNNLEKLNEQIKTLRKQNIYEIDQFTKYLFKLKENLNKVIDIIIVNSGQQKVELNQNNEDQQDEEQIYFEAERINQINQNYYSKLESSVAIIKQIVNIVEKETENLKKVFGQGQYYEEFYAKPIKKVQVQTLQCRRDKFYEQHLQSEICFRQTQEVSQELWCFALAFNKEGSIMAAAAKKDIKIWNFENGQLKDSGIILQGHQLDVTCIVFSKKTNWFITGSIDCKIIGWKKIDNSMQWESSYPYDAQSIVWCLVLNQNEDKLFSGHSNGSIKIWTLNIDKNKLKLHYQLNKHSKHIGQISLNEDDTQLVSCSDDKTIIVWEKKGNQRFKFKQVLENLQNDNGFRVCFLNQDTIAWCQEKQGSIHIFKQETDKFVEKKDLQINLKYQDLKDQQSLFPSIYNKAKQLFIIKHNKYVYLLQQQNQSFHLLSEPIDCRSCKNYGNVTENGNHLILWNDETLSFHVYELKIPMSIN